MKVLIRRTVPYPSASEIKAGDIVSMHNYGFCDCIVTKIEQGQITLSRPVPKMFNGAVEFCVENFTVHVKYFMDNFEVYLYGPAGKDFRKYVDNRGHVLTE